MDNGSSLPMALYEVLTEVLFKFNLKYNESLHKILVLMLMSLFGIQGKFVWVLACTVFLKGWTADVCIFMLGAYF